VARPKKPICIGLADKGIKKVSDFSFNGAPHGLVKFELCDIKLP